MKFQQFSRALKDNSLVLDLNENQTFLLEKIYQFQSKNDYFEIIEFQQQNSDIELEFIDEQLNIFQEKKLLQYNIGELGIIFDFENILDLFAKLNQNMFFQYWANDEKKCWIKKHFLIKSKISPIDALKHIEDNFLVFVESYLTNENFDFETFFNQKIIKPKVSEVQDSFIEENESMVDIAIDDNDNDRTKIKMFFDDLDKKVIKPQKKLAQKNWFEEEE